MSDLELDIDGMSCASCAARIQKKVARIDGVSDATVNFATKTARVTMDDQVCSTDEVLRTIDGLGYHASEQPPLGHHAGHGAMSHDGMGQESRADEMGGHDHMSHGASADLRRRLIVAIPLTIVVVILGMVPTFHSLHWTPLVGLLLATPVVWWSGWPIHQMTWRGLRHRSVGMDTLVTLGSGVAWLWSVYQVAVGGMEVYAEVSAVVITFVLLGRWLEARATDTSVDALSALSQLQVDVVRRVDADGVEAEIPLSQLGVGDRFIVRPGDRVATDGIVADGGSALDLSLVTGESVPVEVASGDTVVGGAVNGSGRLLVDATAVGSDTVLARIGALIKEAQHSKAPIERLVDRIAGVFVPVVLGLSALTLVGWLIAGAEPSFAISAAVAVLVIACPCALGLATPTALVAGSGRGAQLGILIRGPQVLEAAQRIDTVLLDKTGTVTTGEITVESVAGGTAEERAFVGAVESASEHPIARAIASEFATAPVPVIADFAAEAGVGASAEVAGHRVHVGKAVGGLGASLDQAVSAAEAQGLTAVVATVDGEPRMVVTVGDSVKPTSATAIGDLRALGLTPVLLTGDRAATAAAVAAKAGIDDVIADVSPEGKVVAVRERQAAGRRVAMVGDGINDAAALAQADLGIAMGTGTDAAREAADITIVNSDLTSVAVAIELARRTWRTIKQNLGWAFGYNVAAIPLAMSGRLSPMIAGAAMAFSSVLVVSNSLRLRTFHRSR
ncbi:MAG: heavy metal translocating P-type ATPase [Candidatus Nanopelagicales bacterium]